jgi:NADH-quinone oxidoreductase subunit N
MNLTAQHLTALLPILLTGVTALAVMLGIAAKRNHRLSATLTAIGLNLALISCIPAARVGTLAVTPLLVVDGHAALYMALIIASTLATATMAYGYLKQTRQQPDEFYLLLCITAMGGLVLVCANHLAALFIGLELLSVPLLGLIGYPATMRHSLEASLKYLVLSATASAFLAFGLALIYAQAGTMEFPALATKVAQATGTNPWMLLGTGLLLVGLCYKLSLVPFHLWTPDVFEGAPTPSMMFLATVSKTAVFAALMRFYVQAGGAAAPLMTNILAAIALLSIVVGNLLALQQNNIKRLMAYSSIAQFGYCLVALLAGGEFAIEAVGVFLLTYVVTSLGALGVIALVSENRPGEPPGGDAGSLDHYRGIFWRRPYLSAVLVTAMFSLAGVPLTAGFIGKFYVIAAGIDESRFVLLGAVILGSAIGLYYYLRVVITMFAAMPAKSQHIAPLDWAQRTGGVVMMGLAVLMLLLGIVPQAFIAVIREASLTLH